LKPYRSRTVPYKLLGVILYGSSEYVKYTEGSSYILVTGPLSRELAVSNGRILESIKWMQMVGIFTKVDYPVRGQAVVELRIPEVYKK